MPVEGSPIDESVVAECSCSIVNHEGLKPRVRSIDDDVHTNQYQREYDESSRDLHQPAVQLAKISQGYIRFR